MRYQLKTLDEKSALWAINEYANLGKDSQCQIAVTESSAEDRHCRLEIKNNQLFIKDLRSLSGTYVNGARILEAQLNDGDIISLGSNHQSEFVVIDQETPKKDFPLTSRCEYWNSELQSLKNAAQTDHSILLLGESGTGKDVIARSLHESSRRSHQPFLSVNCSALTETLVESELFGHVKGSFTGAISDRKGAFEAARGGTLFLDEIGDLPYSLQSKILRALENQEIRPVGSDRTIKTDVRIIAATHKNLKEKIQEGTFRLDLFYRLNILSVEVPSLNERSMDFDDLIYSFAKEYRVRFSFGAIKKLKAQNWPGNIRELKNFVVRCATYFPKEYISEEHIESLLKKQKNTLAHNGTGVSYVNESNQGQLSVIKEIEKQMILKRLTVNKGNQKLTAKDLGMPKSTLHDRIKTYNIDPTVFK